MTPRSLALVFSFAYLGIGALGFMPGVLPGLFHASPALGVLHIAMGAWALAAYLGPAPAHSYVRSAAFIFAVLALAGLLERIERLPVALQETAWLHLVSAGIAGFVAWRPRTGERRGLAGDRRRGRIAPVAVERRQALQDRRRLPA